MENKQDIGKAFKDRLGGLHREPGDAVWQNISASLQQQKRGGFSMPFWGRATSIILGVVLVAIFTYPQWEQYMPEIIIKMPGEKQQNATGNGNAQTSTVSGTEGNPSVNKTQDTDTATANVQGSTQNAMPNSNTATPRSQDGAPAYGNSTDTPDAKGSLPNGEKHSNALTPAVAHNHGINSTNGIPNNNADTSAKANANRGAGAMASGTKNTGKSAANHSVASTASDTKEPAVKKVNPGKAATQTGIALVNSPSASRTGNGANNTVSDRNTTAVNNAANQNNSVAAVQATAASVQNNAAALQGVTATAATSTGTASNSATTAATTTTRGTAKSVEGNLVYSTGNFPTITKAMADSLLIAQKAIDEKKSRERTFAQPGYALQDNLTGGEGYRNDFYVFAFVAPTNYKFGESTSLIDPSLNHHASSAETANNFGAYLGYEFSSQFSIRTGVSSVGITQRTGNVTMGADYSGVNYANGMTNSQAATALGDSPVTLRQKTSVIEVPLEATYAMFGTRADLYFKGGVSMFFMNENQLFAENSQGSVLLGSLNRAKDFSLSGNAGFGFYYKFTRELQLNVEPGFKYYFNTFEGVNPFSLYVQAGLQYRF